MILGIQKWPVVPTLLVLAAAAVMVRLGFWQLDRLDEKEALIARYEATAERPPLAPQEVFEQVVIDNSARPQDPEELHFRRASFDCARISEWNAIAGRNAQGQPGYAHVAACVVPGHEAVDGASAEAVIGWSREPSEPDWQGGEVAGIIAPGGSHGWRLVAEPPLAGLEANAAPDPNDLPNNHLAYAGQWFFFAVTALVIYVLALRRRERGQN